ncbi:MAG: hypothetical protein ABEL76_12385 [Bradymonadaceae bacterium]
MSNSQTATDDRAKTATDGTSESAEATGDPSGGTESAPSFSSVDDEEEFRQALEHQYAELEETYDELRELAEQYNRTAMEFIREHPAICIGAAAGTGYIIGRLASKRWLK